MSIGRVHTLLGRNAFVRKYIDQAQRNSAVGPTELMRMKSMLLRLQQQLMVALHPEPVFRPVRIASRGDHGTGFQRQTAASS